MELLLSRFRNLSVLLVVIFAQLLLLAVQVKRGDDARLIRVWAVTMVTPLARVLEFTRRNTIGLFEDYIVLVGVREHNRRLEGEIGKLKLENQALRSDLGTADRVQALLAFQKRTPSKMIPSRIIGNGTGMNSRVVYVDQGSRSGVMRGMAVVTPDGIVGKVLAAYPIASQVLLVTDINFAAGVISDKNRVHGTMRGLGQSKCLIDYVQNEEKVEVGEKFFTSGEDRIFPKGMPAGEVTVVRPGKMFKEIYVVPSGTKRGFEEVLIVIEGVHQAIPTDPTEASPAISLLPRPDPKPPASDPASVTTARGIHETEADRLRERYRQIGEAQGHKFGEGASGSRPPDFNFKPKPPVEGAVPGGGAAGAAQGLAKPGASQSPRQGADAQTPPRILRPKPAPPATSATGDPASPGVPRPSAPRPMPAAPKPESERIETPPPAP